MHVYSNTTPHKFVVTVHQRQQYDGVNSFVFVMQCSRVFLGALIYTPLPSMVPIVWGKFHQEPNCAATSPHSLVVSSMVGGGPRVVVSTAAFHARVRGSVPALSGLKETKMFLPHPRVKPSIVGSFRDREVACSASDRQGSNLESCVWRTVSSHSSHQSQEVLLAQFSQFVHKGGLKPDSFHFICVGHGDDYFLKLIYYSLANLRPANLRPGMRGCLIVVSCLVNREANLWTKSW